MFGRIHIWLDRKVAPKATILLRGSLGICPLPSSHGTYCVAAKVNGFNALHSTKMFILFIIKQIWIDNAHLQRTSQLLLGSCNNFNISRSLTFAVLEFPLDWTFRAIWILAFVTWDPDMYAMFDEFRNRELNKLILSSSCRKYHGELSHYQIYWV